MQTTLLNRNSNDSAIITGKHVIRGMRISVEQILKMLARGIPHKEIIEEFPLLEEDDIKACLTYAANLISSEVEAV